MSRVPKREDDLSGHGHRRLIGIFGFLLPLLLWLTAGTRPIPDVEPWQLLGSVSAYYYTGAVAIFVGVLFAISLLLLTYRGYDNNLGWLDRAVGIMAGVAAFGVAFFPTSTPPKLTRLPWYEDWMSYLHFGSAVVLFVMFAVFALVLFPHTDPKKKRTTFRKRLADGRNRTYYACGVVILVAIAVAAWFHQTGRDIFWPEAVAIGAFAVSWLVKGRIGGLPGEAVDHVQDVGRKLRQKLGGEPPAATG